MVEDAVESPKEMLGKEGDVYKLSTDMDPSGWNNRGWEGHLCSRGVKGHMSKNRRCTQVVHYM